MGDVDDRLLRRWEASQTQHESKRLIEERTFALLADVYDLRAPHEEATVNAAEIFFLEDR
ncbi:MAG: hypothetical protein ABI990_06810 [Actinomycetota bacterium]